MFKCPRPDAEVFRCKYGMQNPTDYLKFAFRWFLNTQVCPAVYLKFLSGATYMNEFKPITLECYNIQKVLFVWF